MSENNFIFEGREESNETDERISRNIKMLYVFDNNVILVTNEDTVFCLGDHSYDVLEFDHQNLVEECITNKQTIDISSGQLGINCENHEENELKRIQIEVAIKKISCDHKYCLLLCSEGNIYVFGWNDYEQRGNFTCREKLLNSIKLNHREKIDEISSHFQNNATIALSNNSFYYVWRKFYEEGIISETEETELEMFNDIFTEFLGITVNSLQYSFHIMKYLIPNGKYNNNWKQLENIGKGSYGKVYKVEHKFIEKTISAVKKVPMEEENSINELVISSLILTFNSNHLVRYNDVWYENNFIRMNEISYYSQKYTIFIEMELCDKTLDKIIEEIKESPRLYSNESLTHSGYYIMSVMFIEIFEGVKYLHDKSIIHRDLNPYNILVKLQTNGNCIKIADFNLAVVHEIGKLHTMDKGNANFMAPEVSKRGNYDTKADIYNLGKTLKKMFDMHFNRSTDDFSDIGSDYLIELKNLIESMISRNPQERPNCEQILERRREWAINECDINCTEELKFLLGISEGERSFLQKLIVSKLSYIIENFRLSF